MRLIGFLWTLLLRLTGAVVLLVVLGGGGFVLWHLRSVPTIDGALPLAALDAPVSVTRDAQGVPTITAANEIDAYRALGFVHAQDRLWQMEMMRRLGSGRMAEIAGSTALDADIAMRTLGFERLAKESYQALPYEVQQVLVAYAEGVNTFLEQTKGRLPFEFTLLWVAPEPWQPHHSLLWQRTMAFVLGNDWTDELTRLALSERLSTAQIDTLWPQVPEGSPVTISSKQANAAPLSKLAKAVLQGLPAVLEPQSASNAWILDGTRTASGMPILVNDPHLGFGAPILWYLTRLRTPSLSLDGATVPGVPFHIIGHNGALAWGFTTTHGDTMDVIVEPLGPQEGTYVGLLGPTPFVTHTETIKVRFGDDVVVQTRATQNGPVISDLAGRFGLDEQIRIPASSVLTLKTTALDSYDRTAASVYALNRARSVEAGDRALEDWRAPMQNAFLADDQGHIGVVIIGAIPQRLAGEGAWPIHTDKHPEPWSGTLYYADNPRAMDPTGGLITNGNNRMVDETYPHLIARTWKPPYRATRIESMLRPLTSATLDDMVPPLMDVTSDLVKRVKPIMLAQVQADRLALPEGVLAGLQSWDGAMLKTRWEPLLFAAWLETTRRGVFGDEMDAAFDRWRAPLGPAIEAALTNHQAWCDNTATTTAETCAIVMTQALTDAYAAVAQAYGPAVEAWRWGDAHRARFGHMPLGFVPGLGDLVSHGIPTSGGRETVNRGAYRASEDLATYRHGMGAGLRIAFDLADLSASRVSIATGQSGNPWSRWYGDLLEGWERGQLFRLDGPALHTLTLSPED